jgi:hypothetical protein
MKHGEKTLACLLYSLVLCGAATAVAISSENPYQMVVERNVFALKPPAPAAPDPASIKPPAPKVILNGIITLLGNKRALLKMTPPAAKGEPAKEQSYVLTEGQRDGDLEVIKIDEKAGMVTVNDFGTVTNITFDTNATKTASAPPGMPAPAGAIPPPVMPATFTPPGGGLRSLPTRTLRLPGMNPGAQPPSAGQGASSGAGVGGLSLGGNGVPAGNGSQPTLAEQQPQQGSDEVAAAMLELVREQTKQDVLNGTAAPLPVTHFTPPGSVGIYTEPDSTTQTPTGESGTPTLPSKTRGRLVPFLNL